jgi:hypothetical protein
MNDMNVEILRAGGTATISMDTIRTRYGGSGAISFNDLRKSEGFTAAPADFNNKYINADGWLGGAGGFGSVTPDEGNGRIQFAANSYIVGMYSGDGTNSASIMYMYTDTAFATSGWTSGFAPSNATRIVTANTSRSITGTSDDAGYVQFTYDWPSTGTIHCLVKF